MVVQAAVGDQEHLAPRHLAVDDARHVDAGLADQVAAQFDDQLRLAAVRCFAASTTLREVGGDRGEIERLLAGEVGNAEAAAQVERS